MTWRDILTLAALVAVCTVAGSLGGWWLMRMVERTRSWWPLVVLLVADRDARRSGGG